MDLSPQRRTREAKLVVERWNRQRHGRKRPSGSILPLIIVCSNLYFSFLKMCPSYIEFFDILLWLSLSNFTFLSTFVFVTQSTKGIRNILNATTSITPLVNRYWDIWVYWHVVVEYHCTLVWRYCFLYHWLP